MEISTEIKKYLKISSKPLFAFSLLLAFSIFWGIASFQHIGPGFFDIHINLQISIILNVAFLILLFVSCQQNSMKLTYFTVGWLYFLLLIAVQPAINPIIYSDSLIFVLGEFTLVLMLSSILSNITNKVLVLRVVTIALFLAALFTILTLVIQTLELSSFYHRLVMPIDEGGRPVGNVSQPNQAAFVVVMGVIALLYFKETSFFSRYPFFVLLIFSVFCIALALTSSRGGVILMVIAIFSYILLGDYNYKTKFKQIFLLLSIFIICYWLGSTLLELSRDDAQTGIERFSGSLLKQRSSQLAQALFIFRDNLFTGAGWGNYASAGLAYTDKIDWVYFSNHSHLIFSHIMAELGLLGLVGSLLFVYILALKLFSYKRNSSNKEYRLAMSICLCIAAYSFSEFPLWYFKYLLIFVVYASFLDIKINVKAIGFNKKIAIILPVFMLAITGFYMSHYDKYTKVYDYLVLSDASDEQKFVVYSELAIPYGFTFYNEAMMFYLFPFNQQNLEYKLMVGDRIVHKNPTPTIMIKQAIFLAFDAQIAKSLKLFQASCLYNYVSDCEFVIERLNYLESELPAYFSTVNSEFTEWRERNNIQ